MQDQCFAETCLSLQRNSTTLRPIHYLVPVECLPMHMVLVTERDERGHRVARHMFTPCSQLFDHLVLVIVYWEIASGVVYFLLLEWFLVSRGVVPSK